MSQQDSYVQVAPDSTGKRIRNVTFQALQADGTVITVQQQVIGLVNVDGVPVDIGRDNDVIIQVLKDIRRELRVQTKLTAESNFIKDDLELLRRDVWVDGQQTASGVIADPETT